MSKFNRNSVDVDNTKSNPNVVDNEVKKLIKQNPHNISTSAMYKLRERYQDQDLLDAIQDGFIERTREIRKKGKKFARMVRDKYSNTIPLHMLLKKAHKFKNKYKLSDAEFSEFRRVYEQTLAPENNTRPTQYNITTPFTNMSRVLGQGLVDADDGLKFDEKDYDSIQQILRLNSECTASHNQVVLQSMEYKDMAMQALSGEYDRRRNNPHCHVHPVIAAMFLPKIEIFEENMIYASISYIVKQKYMKKPIMTSNDYELFYNIIRDPTDVVCSSESAVKDLLKRSQLQCKLWMSISTLRNGRYYDCAVNDLSAAIDTCRRNYEENPDLIYDSDEGSYLTKIFAAFSLRPTVIAQTPLVNQQILSIGAPVYGGPVVPKVHTQPFITIRLPPQTNIFTSQTFSVDLQNYVSSHHQFIMEEGQLVQKTNEVIYSNGVLVYYVPRRSNLMNIGKLVNPLEFNRLPRVVHGFDRLNETAINVPQVISVGQNQSFRLKSAVLLDVQQSDKNNLNINDNKLIIGNYSILYDENNTPFEYNPRKSAIHFETADFSRTIPVEEGKDGEKDPKIDSLYNYQQPVSCLQGINDQVNERLQTRGTIFIYKDTNPVKHQFNTIFGL